MASLVSTLLADVGMSGSQITLLVWGVIALLVVNLIGAGEGIVKIIAFFRPNPPLHDQYATKAELEASERRTSGSFVETHKALAEIFNSLRDFNRALGRIEGALGTKDGPQKKL